SSVQCVVRRIESESSNRIRREAAGDKRPADTTVGKCISGPPHSTACRGCPNSTTAAAAAWVDSERGYPTRSCIRRSAESQNIRKILAARSRKSPRTTTTHTGRLQALCSGPSFSVGPGVVGIARQCKRHICAAGCANRIGCFSCRRWAAFSFGTRQRQFVSEILSAELDKFIYIGLLF